MPAWRRRGRGQVALSPERDGDRNEERRRFLAAPSREERPSPARPLPAPPPAAPSPAARRRWRRNRRQNRQRRFSRSRAPPRAPPVPASPPRPPAEGEDEDEGEDDDDFQFLRCDGCGQDSARPRLLACLHTLCPACLSDTKQCPRCQAATAAPAVDNLLFCNLRSRLQLWRQIRSAGGPGCGRCRAEAALVWCEECEEFLCGRCLEEHQWWHKKKAHRVRRVGGAAGGSARQFLEETRAPAASSAPAAATPRRAACAASTARAASGLCAVRGALLDTGHAPFRDLRAESRRRQDELRSLRRDLRRLRRAFEAAAARLRGEAARREEQRERLRERVRASAERLQELVRSEAEELRALLEARPERGRSALAEELLGAEGTLLRLEAAERLVERLGRYGGEQELMDMQPFVKGALLELRRLRPPQAPELREPPDITECRVRLRALVERVTGRPDIPEVEVAWRTTWKRIPNATASPPASRRSMWS
ncbi:LOW QUALITY PROTEIN: protein PML, partial [Vidua macroura]|uniref:LOW QUALITY PROTEIN: protein PML n=1 Tax=Vidua macroura TaxID=187451 RepID=UPI0023A8CB5A